MKDQNNNKGFIFNEKELVKLSMVAQEELIIFLEKNPEFKKFQKTIDRQIKGAETFEKRMMALGFSFKEKRLLGN